MTTTQPARPAYPGTFVLVGVDPGPTTGIVAMRWAPDVRYVPNIIHCDADTALLVVRAVTSKLYLPGPDCPVVVAVEDFVDGNRHDRSTAARVTRDVICEIEDAIPDMLTRVLTYQPAQHKDWEGKGKRLKAAGLWERTDGRRHARSAASVALYAAVRGSYRRDPLSRDADASDWFGP